MENATILKIFLASPGDVKPEREIIFALKDDIDHLIGKPNGIRFEFVNWERSSYPGVGIDAQDVINQNINDDYNIFLGIFWQRFGTPTTRAESGTEEEFVRAYEKYKKNPDSNHVMLYFKTEAPQNIYDLDYKQFEKVKEFKKNIQDQGILYWEFERSDDLKNILLIHLSSLVRDKYSVKENKKSTPVSQAENIDSTDKYESIAKSIEDEKSIVSIEGMIELSESSSDAMILLPNILVNIRNAIEFIGGKFREKTIQINAISKIKDERLRLKKAKFIINGLSTDLDKYSSELSEFLPEFKQTLNTAIESYTKLLLLASESTIFIEEVENQLQAVVPVLSGSLDTALTGIAEFLQSLTDLPVMTSKFGTSKRQAELTTNEVFREFISAKKVMKQLMG